MGPVKLGGRSWSYTFGSYDLTPEARYEYCWTMAKVGSPLKFPHEAGRKKKPKEGWRQECPYCEISTDELGEAVCPKCGRELADVRYAD